MNRSTHSLIDEYKLNFEDTPSNLGRFLSQHGALERSQIQTLILWQLAESWRNGNGLRTEEYLHRYPDWFVDREWVLDLIYAEFIQLRKLDSSTSLEEFSLRFPSYATQLKQQVEFYESIGSQIIDDCLEDEDQLPLAMVDSINACPNTGDRRPAPSPLAPAANSRVPEFDLPGYRIIRELGRGGWAVVYLAEDLRLHRHVALKMLLAGKFASQSLLRRMEKEGEAIARLQHPNIVQIYEVGQYGDYSFLALELANSGTLASWMRRRPISPSAAGMIIRQLARTVQFAHNQGILHRDLKPSNVLLHDLSLANSSECAAESQPSTQKEITHLQLKIADFGLAKFINSDAHEVHAAAATLTGDLVGTAAYMSPEQAKGAAKHLTPAADIYSLGAILYELLTGRPPFLGVEPLEMLQRVLVEDPVRPMVLVPNVPRDIETICLKCLHKSPARRYATADELADELDRFLSNQPITARRTSMLERNWRWCRRHPARSISILSAATILLLVMAGLITYSAVMRDRIERISIANDREKALRTEALNRLFESHLSRASALLTSQQVGQRFTSLAALDDAQSLDSILKLDDQQFQRIRNGVLVALNLPDIQYLTRPSIPYDSTVHAIAINLQHRVLAIPTSATQVKLFDGQTAAELRTIETHMPIRRLALDEKAALLAVVGDKLHVLDLTSQPPTLKLELPACICSFATDNARELLTLDSKSVLRRVNLDTSAQTIIFRSSGRPRQVIMSPDGRFLALRTDDRIEVVEVRTGVVLLQLPPTTIVENDGLVWSRDSERLAVGPGPLRRGVELWDVASRTKLFTVPQSDASLKFFFDASGSRLLTISQWGRYVKLWNLVTRECEFTQKNLYVRYAIVGSEGFHLWQAESEDELTIAVVVVPVLHRMLPSIARASASASNVCVDYNSTGNTIGMVKDGTLELYDANSLQMLTKFVVGGAYFRFDPQGNLITLNTLGLQIWPKHSVQESSNDLNSQTVMGPPQKVLDAPPLAPFEVSRDGNLIGVSDGVSVRVWSKLENREVANLPHPDVRRISLSPDNSLCATGGWNTGNVNVWSLETGTKVKQIVDPSPCIVRFSSDGKWLAVGSNGISVWKTNDWQLAWRCDVEGLFSNGMNLCFSPDSRQLAVSDARGKIQLLEVHNEGREYAEITSPLEDQILDMIFAPGGKQLAVLTTRGVSIWDFDRLRDELAVRRLDWDQRIESYFPVDTKSSVVPSEPAFAPAASLSFLLNEEFRQLEATEQAVRVQSAIENFDYHSARSSVQRALELKLNDISACNELAWNLVTGPVELRNPDAALELIRRAVNHPNLPTARRSLYLNTLGVALYRAGQVDEAFETLTESLANQAPKDQPHDLYFLAMCAARRGDQTLAKEFFDQAESLRQTHYSTISLPWSRELAEFSLEARVLLK